MQTHVYANGREIACKAAGQDGVSPQAFPDPCWSPPGPAAGPIVIPYPNTCFADSITNGTSTVFICGKEVAVEDQSYFGTSTGNEPATQAFKKGVATGVITGKAYFTQWSFDVVFEGLGVPRHEDLVSHNHGSVPGNTPYFPYISRGIFSSFPCKKEFAKINRACSPEKDDSDYRKELKSKSLINRFLKTKRSGNKERGIRDSQGWHWTDDHCDGLEVALVDPARAKAYAEEMKSVFKSLPKELNLLDSARSALQDMVANAAGKAAAKVAAKAGIKQAAGSALPAVGNFLMALWTAYDAAAAVGSVKELRAVATASLERLNILKSRMTQLQTLANGNAGLTEKQAHALAVEGQELIATLNDCVRAMKCNLVPYKSQRGPEPEMPKHLEPMKHGGCCFGQTGHHLIPKKSIESACNNSYDHNLAPTVCVEGTSQNFGSHKEAHLALSDEHDTLFTNGKVGPDGRMSMSDAITAAVNSHEAAFPLSNCSSKCIRAQLEAYYKVCGNGRPYRVNAQAKVVKTSKPVTPPPPPPPQSGPN